MSVLTPQTSIFFTLLILFFLSLPYCDSAPRVSMAICNITYINPNTSQVLTEGYVGSFGTGLHTNVSGLLVSVRTKTLNNNDAGCDTYNMSIPTFKWVALMRRGVCTFHSKIHRAKENNATAVVVYNAKGSGNKFYMVHQVEGIVAVSIDYKSGKRLVDLINQGINISINISVGSSLFRKNMKIPKKEEYTFLVSIVFAMVSVVTIIVVSLGWLAVFLLQKCR